MNDGLTYEQYMEELALKLNLSIRGLHYMNAERDSAVTRAKDAEALRDRVVANIDSVHFLEAE